MGYRDRHRSHGKKGFAVGAVLGGLIGGIAALLYAPKSGDKMRKDLAKRYQTVSDKTCDLLDDVCDQTNDLVDKAKDMAKCAKDAALKICRKD